MSVISENLDILYELGKYNKRVFVINKQIWGLKLSRINYIDAKVLYESEEIGRYTELLKKAGKILVAGTVKDNDISHTILFLNCLKTFTGISIKKIKIKTFYPLTVSYLKKLVKCADILKIECKWYDFIINNFVGYCKLATKYPYKVIFRFTRVSCTDDASMDALTKIMELKPDTKLRIKDYTTFKYLKNIEKISPNIVNPEKYKIYEIETEELILTTFSKERSIRMGCSRYVQNKLFISILTNTEKVRINCRYLDQYAVQKVLDLVSKLDLPNLKLIIFKVPNRLNFVDIGKKYSYLRVNVVFV